MHLRAAPDERPKTPRTDEQEKLRRLAKAHPQKVVVVDIQVPFWSWVWLLVYLAVAAIPAAVIVAILIWGGLLALEVLGKLL